MQRALLLLRRHELSLHQIHLLLESLHGALEREALRLLRSQRALARGGRLIEQRVVLLHLLEFELESFTLWRSEARGSGIRSIRVL